MELTKQQVANGVRGLLKLGRDPKQIAEELGIKPAIVTRIRNEMSNEELRSDVGRVDMDLLRAAVAKLKQEATSEAMPAVAEELDKVVTGVKGLQALEHKFQQTTSLVLERFDRELRDPTLSIDKAQSIMSSVSNAYEKIFATGTQIHIGDNNSVSNQQLTIFKSKQGV